MVNKERSAFSPCSLAWLFTVKENIMGILFGNILLQIGFFIGAVYLVGFLISLLNRLFYSLVDHSQGVCYATGFIGTPIHELSHALMCVVFRHKIEV